MSSYMLQKFATYAMLCRLGGCFFIQNFHKDSLINARVSWKSPYTLYTASCLVVIAIYQVTYMVKRVDILKDISRNFSLSLILILQATITLKIGINFVSMVAGSARLLEFFQNSAAFEKSTCFLLCKGRGPSSSRRSWSLLRRLCIIGALINSYVLAMHFFVGGLLTKALPAQWILAGKITGSVVGLFFFLYDSLPYVVLRCCSAVLVEYVRAQLIIFERCNRSSVFSLGSQASQLLQVIRCNLVTIKELKQSLNAAWQCALAASSAGILFVVCIVVYSLFHEGLYKYHIWTALSYCVYSSLSFMEMAYVSQALADEAQKLKDATEAVPTAYATFDYVRQLRFLHDTIEPEGMCLNSGDLFRLNKSLLVSMACAVITYTVILVQTSDDLSYKTSGSDGLATSDFERIV